MFGALREEDLGHSADGQTGQELVVGEAQPVDLGTVEHLRSRAVAPLHTQKLKVETGEPLGSPERLTTYPARLSATNQRVVKLGNALEGACAVVSAVAPRDAQIAIARRARVRSPSIQEAGDSPASAPR
ncbi:hypothetical protein [Sorangium sp. So ce128]|uniref:hypothetical protein n=1 Tax=Sorangium sp. So ce128 TaxID=3133281 RepID=UPI003F6296F3